MSIEYNNDPHYPPEIADCINELKVAAKAIEAIVDRHGSTLLDVKPIEYRATLG